MESSNGEMIELIKIFTEYGLTIYDVTPNDNKRWRENEIKAWIEENEVESFVILDDDSYRLQSFLHKELIKTSLTKDDEMVTNMEKITGLCKEHVEEAIKILNHTKKKSLRKEWKR